MRETYKQRIGEWSVLMEWPEGAESGGPVRLVVEPIDLDNPPPGGLSSTVLRDVDFQEAAAKLSGFFEMARGLNRSRDEHAGRELQELLAVGVTHSYLVRLCQEYIELVKRGRARPSEYLAELVGKNPSTIKGHLWKAKKEGLFVGAHGRVGGKLTSDGARVAHRMFLDSMNQADRRRWIEEFGEEPLQDD